MTPEMLKSEAQSIRATYGTTRPGDYVGRYLRHSLEGLAVAAGLSADHATAATDNDLISVYTVACKDGKAAQVVAAKLATRFGGGGLIDPPPPPPPTGGATIDVETVRTLIKTEVREGALAPVQAALDAAMADVPLKATEAAVQVMRAEMRVEAHAAALEALKSLTPTRLEIQPPDNAPPIQLGLVHRLTPKIIAMLRAGVNVYLHGPAGSGKTTVARKCAEAFSLQFYFAAKVESEYQLLGFKDAKGDTIRTQFREAYEHGGVFLFDEMDASSPSAVVALNAALANGICPFPDAIVSRHANFLCIGAGNTKLTGANRQYAGRNQLDAASIDRFAFLEFGYDNDLENALASDVTWAKYVQRVREVIAQRGLNHLVTPRATYDGCKLLAAGMDREDVKAMVVYKGLDVDTVKQIEAAL